MQSVPNLPSSQNATQQGSPSNVNFASLSVAITAPTADPKKRKLIQQQLVLLLHAQKCQWLENQANGEVWQCVVPNCRTMKNILDHMATCQAEKFCIVPHCSSSRQLISHWKNCSKSDCPLCLPPKEAFDHHQQAQFNEVQVAQCSPQALNHIQTQVQQSTKLQSTPQFQGTLRQMVSTGSTQSSGNMVLNTGDSNVQNIAKLKAGAEDQLTVRPGHVVHNVVPQNPSNVKDWHQNVTQELREHLVQKIVQGLFPTTDLTALQDKRMISLVAYAKVVADISYEKANSMEEYYQLLTEKMYEIRKVLEEKRQRRRE